MIDHSPRVFSRLSWAGGLNLEALRCRGGRIQSTKESELGKESRAFSRYKKRSDVRKKQDANLQKKEKGGPCDVGKRSQD